MSEELIEDVNSENRTDKLLMRIIKQNQELKERLENLENKHQVSNTLQINNTYNIYLNENTDVYKIFDEYEIPNKNKLAKLAEMCTDSNKLAYLVRPPMKDYIKKHDLLYTDKKQI